MNLTIGETHSRCSLLAWTWSGAEMGVLGSCPLRRPHSLWSLLACGEAKLPSPVYPQT